MQSRLKLIGVATLTFLAGNAASVLVDLLATKHRLRQLEVCSNYASAVMLWREPQLIPPAVHRCGHFVITVNDRRELYLNSSRMGEVNNPRELLHYLQFSFAQRTQLHVYRPGMENALETPLEERIDKTVYLKVDRSLTFAEVQDLIESLKAVGANPIGLVSEPPWEFTVDEM